MKYFKYTVRAVIVLITFFLISSCSDSPSSSELEELGVISITNISNGDVLSGEVDLNLTVTSTGSFSKIELFIRGEKVDDISTSANSFNLTTWEFDNGEGEIKVVGTSASGESVEATYSVEFENYLMQWNANEYIDSRLDNDLLLDLKLFISDSDGNVLSDIHLPTQVDGIVKAGAPEELDNLPSTITLTLYSQSIRPADQFFSEIELLFMETVANLEPWINIESTQIKMGSSIKSKQSEFLSSIEQKRNDHQNSMAYNTTCCYDVKIENIVSTGEDEIRLTNYRDTGGSSSTWNTEERVVGDVFDFSFNGRELDPDRLHLLTIYSQNLELFNESRYYFIDPNEFEDTINIDYQDMDRFSVVEVDIDPAFNNYTSIGHDAIYKYDNGFEFILRGNHLGDKSEFYYLKPDELEVVRSSVKLSNDEHTQFSVKFDGDILRGEYIEVNYELSNRFLSNFKVENEGEHNINRLNFATYLHLNSNSNYYHSWTISMEGGEEEVNLPNLNNWINPQKRLIDKDNMSLRNLNFYKYQNIQSIEDYFKYVVSGRRDYDHNSFNVWIQ